MTFRVPYDPMPRCTCGHSRERHFKAWNMGGWGACMVPMCECRAHRETNPKKEEPTK